MGPANSRSLELAAVEAAEELPVEAVDLIHLIHHHLGSSVHPSPPLVVFKKPESMCSRPGLEENPRRTGPNW